MMNLDFFYSKKNVILQNSLDFFLESIKLTPKIGFELEFFLVDENFKQIKNNNIIYDFLESIGGKKEKAESQIEITSNFTQDLLGLCEEIQSKKEIILKVAKSKNLNILFSTKPFKNECSSALQFNISLHDNQDKNMFFYDEKILKYSICGLLEMTNKMMILLSPNDEDFARFYLEENRKLFKCGKFTAPVNLSFGVDNRTCAIRIVKNKLSKRLEYRVASSTADPYLSIASILLAINFGIKNKKENFQQIFGNAFDDIYHLEPLCINIKEANDLFFQEENFIYQFFKKL